jgi:hypothetical protein
MVENRRPLLSLLLYTALLLTATTISEVSGQSAGECMVAIDLGE